MPLIDDLKLPTTERAENRREFLAVAGAGALALAGLGTSVTAVRFLWPEVLFEEETRFTVGRPEEIAQGTLLVLPEQKVFVVHDAEGFFALSATCTHLGCIVKPTAAGFECPCHGSRFARDGSVTKGPAPKALPWLGVSVASTSVTVDEDAVVPQGTKKVAVA